jgi:hypothetical protein
MTLKYVDRRSVRGRRALRDGLGGAFSQQRPEGRAALIAAHRPTEQGDPRKSRAMPSPVASRSLHEILRRVRYGVVGGPLREP